MITLSSNGNLKIDLKAIIMGEDLCVTITGGEAPHLGAVAVGIPRESHLNNKTLSSTVSVITLIGHKEDEIVKPTADMLAKELNKNVVVSCGIHIDDINNTRIDYIVKKINEMLYELIAIIKNNSY